MKKKLFSLKGMAAAAAILMGVPGAAQSAQVTDFVFMIDATGSMGGEIAGVRNGFSTFVGNLNTNNIDARFAVVLFGGQSELILDFTSDQTATQNALNGIVIGAGAGQNNHNFNPEAGLETIRQVLGAAPNSVLASNNLPPQQDGILNFRNNARKNLILVTDEDSDRPFHAVNRFGNQSFNLDPPLPFGVTAGWQEEVDATAQAVIDAQAYLNMLIGVDGSTKEQYGDFTKDVSDANLLNFDQELTKNALLADTRTDNSLQAQVLSAGLLARTFNVADANDPDFVNNFFAAKLEEVINDPGPLPEPGMVAVFGLALAGLGLMRRRRSR